MNKNTVAILKSRGVKKVSDKFYRRIDLVAYTPGKDKCQYEEVEKVDSFNAGGYAFIVFPMAPNSMYFGACELGTGVRIGPSCASIDAVKKAVSDYMITADRRFLEEMLLKPTSPRYKVVDE